MYRYEITYKIYQHLPLKQQSKHAQTSLTTQFLSNHLNIIGCFCIIDVLIFFQKKYHCQKLIET